MNAGTTPDVRAIDVETLAGWIGQGDVELVDIREPCEFAEGSIPGAVLVPTSIFDPACVPRPEGKRVVIYCEAGVRSEQAARRLLRAGRSEVVHLAGGIRAWRTAGKEVRGGRGARVSIARQVQIAAGSMVAAGAGLALVSPWFLILPAFVGLGLVFAGVSNTCGMAALLSVMPWNREPA